MKLFLDDIRDIPSGFIGCRTADQAIEKINTGKVQFISFDHDLGTELTGYDVACHIESLVYQEKINLPQWKIHSANPVGRQNIARAMESAERITRGG